MITVLRSASILLLLAPVHGSISTSATAAYSPKCFSGEQRQIWVPGGPTKIGDDAGYADERPSYVTAVDGFAISATEVSNTEFSKFVVATGHISTAEKRGSSLVFSPPKPGQTPTHPSEWWKIVDGADWRHPDGPGSSITGKEHFPVTHVSYTDAQAFARWRGERLPNEEEFERAARAGMLDASQQPAPDSANTWQGQFPYANLAKDGHAGIAPVGCFQPSAYDLHDVIGNVWEWTSSYYLPGHGPTPSALGEGGPLSFDPNQPGREVRVIKGGSFLCAPNYCARYRPSARHAQAIDETASHIGFRTVRSER